MEETITKVQSSKIEEWFDNLIATLRLHEQQLEMDNAPEGVKQFYQTMVQGNQNEIFHLSKVNSQTHFVSNIIFDYLKNIKDNFPERLAFDFNDSEVLVWAEIDDDNEEMEKALFLAEAKVNATYHPYGFDMTSVIVEKSDKQSIPNHYKVFRA